jgi:hypothetical protein
LKQFIGTWKIGDRVTGRVTEQLSTSELIISFNGDLLRVANETKQDFAIGQYVELMIATLNPITFRVAPPRLRARQTGKMDISV